jgi:EPS-associated MarR family transcriptional regulator
MQILRDEMYFRVLRALEKSSHVTQRELANETNISLGGINYCLKALSEKGWIKIRNFQKSKNRISYVYKLTPLGIAEKLTLTQTFLAKKLAEYESLKADIEALQQEVFDKS